MANWKKARPLNDLPALVAVPGMYEITGLDTNGKVFRFSNFTKSVRLRPSGAAIYVGVTEAGMDGSNRDTVADGTVYQVDMQTPALYVRAASGTATLNATIVLSDIPVPTDFGELGSANGFDGGDTSTPVVDLS